MIRILIVDDSPTARALLASIVALDPELRVVGEAADGHAAVRLAEELRPDLVLMDARMPGMDGFEATREIMTAAPTPVVIVTASFEPGDVQAAPDALSAGALTVVDKPPGPASPRFHEVARQFIATVKNMAQVKVIRRHRPRPPLAPLFAARPEDVPAEAEAPPPPRRAVAVATSTGGPAALARMLPLLPGDFPAPILVVQHISPAFTGGLAHWLKSLTRLRVKIAEAGEPLLPGRVYLAPDHRHLGATPQATVLLSDAPPVGGFRPSGTFLFESVAAAFGAGAVAVVLTGMGADGTDGLPAVRRTGGYVIAQDEATSVVFGMPASAIAAGLADAVLPLDEIAGRLLALVR
jgi:two-component system chemotaxis response regulator CheB